MNGNSMTANHLEHEIKTFPGDWADLMLPVVMVQAVATVAV
jgi:hypothetical protein